MFHSALKHSHISNSYNPYDGPNDNPEVELPLTAGEYIYVYGDMDDDGFYEGTSVAAAASHFCLHLASSVSPSPCVQVS